MYRKQALEWIKADLAAWKRHFDADPAKYREEVHREMTKRLADPSFAPVRDPKALALLPADEREAWEKLWADVAALLIKAEVK